MWFENLLKLRCVAPVALAAAVFACGDGAGSDPIIPDAPNNESTGGGGAGGGEAGGMGGQPLGGMGGQTPMPDPTSEWNANGNSHDLRPELHAVSPNEVHAIAIDPNEVGDVIAMWNGIDWTTMTSGRGGLKPAFHYIPPIDLEPASYVAVVSNHIEMWDGLAWNLITNDAPGIHAGLHYVDVDTIYAPVGQQIQMWDGLQQTWLPMTDDVAAPDVMTGAFHWVSDTEIYALVKDGTSAQILLWDGAWKPHAAPMEGLKPEMHVVSPHEIYAVIGTQICVWNGSAWSVYTDDLSGLQTAFSFLGPDDIYAIASDQVWRWAP